MASDEVGALDAGDDTLLIVDEIDFVMLDQKKLIKGRRVIGFTATSPSGSSCMTEKALLLD